MPLRYRPLKDKTADKIVELTRFRLLRWQEHAFDHNGLFFVYSGPFCEDPDFFPAHAPFAPYTNNGRRTAMESAAIPNAVFLDASKVGLFLFTENNLFVEVTETYTKFYGKTLSPPDLKRKINNAIDQAGAFVSIRYIEASFGECVSCVCGAGLNRMSRLIENRALVSNQDIEIINSFPRQPYLEFYNINRDEAFQLICWTELLRAKKAFELAPSAEKQRTYAQLKFFYNYERAEMASENEAQILKSDEARRREDKRGRILSPYGMDHIPGEIEVIAPGTILSLPQRYGEPLKTYKNKIVKPII